MMADGASPEDLRERMFGPQEDLCEELERCHYTDDKLGSCIKHPLYISIMHHPAQNHMANEALTTKKEMVERYVGEKNWYGLVFVCYERPWRLQAIAEYADQMTDEQYWEVLGGAWTDSENIWEMEDEWIEMLDSDRPGRSNMMEDEEREHLALLPERLTIYRGFSLRSRQYGLSWSLDRQQAEWFAKRLLRPGETPRLAIATLPRDKAIAYFNGRGEDEIVCLADHAHIEEVIHLDQ